MKKLNRVLSSTLALAASLALISACAADPNSGGSNQPNLPGIENPGNPGGEIDPGPNPAPNPGTNPGQSVGGTDTVQGACEYYHKAFEELETKMDSYTEAQQADPAIVAEMLDFIQNHFKTTANGIIEPEIRELAGTVADGYSALFGTMIGQGGANAEEAVGELFGAVFALEMKCADF